MIPKKITCEKCGMNSVKKEQLVRWVNPISEQPETLSVQVQRCVSSKCKHQFLNINERKRIGRLQEIYIREARILKKEALMKAWEEGAETEAREQVLAEA